MWELNRTGQYFSSKVSFFSPNGPRGGVPRRLRLQAPTPGLPWGADMDALSGADVAVDQGGTDNWGMEPWELRTALGDGGGRE
jgi:hypothetical protein